MTLSKKSLAHCKASRFYIEAGGASGQRYLEAITRSFGHLIRLVPCYDPSTFCHVTIRDCPLISVTEYVDEELQGARFRPPNGIFLKVEALRPAEIQFRELAYGRITLSSRGVGYVVHTGEAERLGAAILENHRQLTEEAISAEGRIPRLYGLPIID